MVPRTKTAGRETSGAVRILRVVFVLCVLAYLCYGSFFGNSVTLRKAYRVWLYGYLAFGTCWLGLFALMRLLSFIKTKGCPPQEPSRDSSGAVTGPDRTPEDP